MSLISDIIYVSIRKNCNTDPQESVESHVVQSNQEAHVMLKYLLISKFHKFYPDSTSKKALRL